MYTHALSMITVQYPRVLWAEYVTSLKPGNQCGSRGLHNHIKFLIAPPLDCFESKVKKPVFNSFKLRP